MTALKRIGILTILAAALLVPTGAAEARHRGGSGTSIWIGPGGFGYSRGYGGYGYGGYGGYYSPYYRTYPYRSYYYSSPYYGGYYNSPYYGYSGYYYPGYQYYVW